MDWLVFTYSLPTESGSSPRVALWRRLRRLGALAVAGGAQVLPAREECREAFNWMAQEISLAGGEALVMSVTQFAGLSDARVVDLFQHARTSEYEQLAKECTTLEQTLEGKETAQVLDALQRLRKQFETISRADYFACPSGVRVATSLARIARTISPPAFVSPLPLVNLDDFRDKRWVTRPHPYVDRLATIWLIRRFINPKALIRYALIPEPGEVSFDMEGGEFSHHGQLCTFEVFVRTFSFDDPALRTLAEIAHEIDLHDDIYAHPEIAGIERLLEGWSRSKLTDIQIEEYGYVLFDGLYQAFSSQNS